MRQPLPQLRIIQQQFDRPDKRPYSSTAPSQSSGKVNTSEKNKDSSKVRLSSSNESRSSASSSSEPPTKIRKKPGRKPNPASPAIRKEQNRAAQRAFRDRKERHLLEMENTLNELKETNTKISQRSQQDAQQFKATLEALQGENYYLRQVVYSFESALGKGGHVAILHEVKAELYHRHYEKYASTKTLAGSTSSNRDSGGPPVPSIPSLFIPIGTFSQSDAQGTCHRTQERSPSNSTTTSTACSKTAIPSTSTTPSSLPSPSSPLDATSPGSTSSPKIPISNLWGEYGDKPTDSQDDILFSSNNSIFYRAPTPSSQPDTNSGKLVKAVSPLEPLSPSRPFFTETGAYLAKRTEYTQNGNVFDELQSSLFPPGTLQSLFHTGLATPQEVVNDSSLLDQLQNRRPHWDPVICPGQAAIAFSTPTIDGSLTREPTSVLDNNNHHHHHHHHHHHRGGNGDNEDAEEDNGDNEFEMASTTLGLDDGLKQQVIPSKRLQLEIKVLASAPPAVDPNIDSKIYALPHDSRIDLIPCPRLRAQMILHQKRFDVDELCQLLLNGAKCHGHPLDPHSWELPESFFDRYGFLLGEDMLRHRNKCWPK
ncbi:hypothetical protein BGZ65_012067 [Modicella reniformis]|uniref:BZIP domain-containing protein n=1 Tax=Modicella reniformis TaxID=1440133 RepID=A0A9P6MJU5_9FUNG|nr:hypothetical protein BGZ65_012067 [Modicella reniformis]